jgi:hypothetical protein
MMDATAELTQAFALGDKKLAGTGQGGVDGPFDPGTSKTTVLPYDDNDVRSIPDAASASKIRYQIQPGQRVGGRGTTIYNPLRSDPRVEAVLGELRYKAKPREDTPDALKLKMAQQQEAFNVQIAALTAKVESLTRVVAGEAPSDTGEVTDEASGETETSVAPKAPVRRRRR